jgi:AMMECR1 domain-containing protein
LKYCTKIGSLKPSLSLRIAKFVASAAASGDIKELRGSIGESLEAKKMMALIASAIGIIIATLLIIKAIKALSCN